MPPALASFSCFPFLVLSFFFLSGHGRRARQLKSGGPKFTTAFVASKSSVPAGCACLGVQDVLFRVGRWRALYVNMGVCVRVYVWPCPLLFLSGARFLGRADVPFLCVREGCSVLQRRAP